MTEPRVPSSAEISEDLIELAKLILMTCDNVLEAGAPAQIEFETHFGIIEIEINVRIDAEDEVQH